MWMTVGTEKKLNDRWNFGAGIELRTKDNSGSIDRWQLAINGAYKVSKFLIMSGDRSMTYTSSSSGSAFSLQN